MGKTNYNNNKMCFKCKSFDVELKEEKVMCNCGADIHFKKTCKKCGFTTYLYRYIFVEPVAM
jgi:hypothetical protein